MAGDTNIGETASLTYIDNFLKVLANISSVETINKQTNTRETKELKPGSVHKSANLLKIGNNEVSTEIGKSQSSGTNYVIMKSKDPNVQSIEIMPSKDNPDMLMVYALNEKGQSDRASPLAKIDISRPPNGKSPPKDKNFSLGRIIYLKNIKTGTSLAEPDNLTDALHKFSQQHKVAANVETTDRIVNLNSGESIKGISREPQQNKFSELPSKVKLVSNEPITLNLGNLGTHIAEAEKMSNGESTKYTTMGKYQQVRGDIGIITKGGDGKTTYAAFGIKHGGSRKYSSGLQFAKTKEDTKYTVYFFNEVDDNNRASYNKGLNGRPKPIGTYDPDTGKMNITKDVKVAYRDDQIRAHEFVEMHFKTSLQQLVSQDPDEAKKAPPKSLIKEQETPQSRQPSLKPLVKESEPQKEVRKPIIKTHSDSTKTTAILKETSLVEPAKQKAQPNKPDNQLNKKYDQRVELSLKGKGKLSKLHHHMSKGRLTNRQKLTLCKAMEDGLNIIGQNQVVATNKSLVSSQSIQKPVNVSASINKYMTEYQYLKQKDPQNAKILKAIVIGKMRPRSTPTKPSTGPRKNV